MAAVATVVKFLCAMERDISTDATIPNGIAGGSEKNSAGNKSKVR